MEKLPAVGLPDEARLKDWQADLALQVHSGIMTETLKRTYEWGFAQFLDWLNAHEAKEVSNGLIRQWIHDLQVQGHNSFSIKFWFDCVRIYYNWAVSSGITPADPTTGIKIELRSAVTH